MAISDDIITKGSSLLTDMTTYINSVYDELPTYPDLETDKQNTIQFYTDEIQNLTNSTSAFFSNLSYKAQRENVYRQYIVMFFTVKNLMKFDLSELDGIDAGYSSVNFYNVYRYNIISSFFDLVFETDLFNGIYKTDILHPELETEPDNSLFLDFISNDIESSWFTNEINTISSFFNTVSSKSMNASLRLFIMDDMGQIIPIRTDYTPLPRIDEFLDISGVLYMITYMNLEVPTI